MRNARRNLNRCDNILLSNLFCSRRWLYNRQRVRIMLAVDYFVSLVAVAVLALLLLLLEAAFSSSAREGVIAVVIYAWVILTPCPSTLIINAAKQDPSQYHSVLWLFFLKFVPFLPAFGACVYLTTGTQDSTRTLGGITACFMLYVLFSALLILNYYLDRKLVHFLRVR